MKYEKSRRVCRRIMIAICLFVGVGAMAGGGCMLADPSGRIMGMDAILPFFCKMPLADLLFRDFTFAGISLIIVNGISNLAAAVLLLRRKRLGAVLGWVFGVTLMLWICIQFWLFAPAVAALDVIFFAIGFVQFAVGFLYFVRDSQQGNHEKAEPCPAPLGTQEAVVFFSRTGSCRRLAQEKAATLGCDLLEIQTTEKVDGDLGFWWCGRFSMHRWGMPLKPLTAELSAYRKVWLVSPVWAFSICAPVRQLLNENADKLPQTDLTLVHFCDGRLSCAASEAEKLIDSNLCGLHSVVSRFGKLRKSYELFVKSNV